MSEVEELIKIAYLIGYLDKEEGLPKWTNIKKALEQINNDNRPIIVDVD
jgi:hypothetical protein